MPWKDHGVEIVLECSGKLRSAALLAPYFAAGVKKVIVAAPVKEEALNVVVGVNDHLYDPDKHHLLTAASCTTNCLAPVVKVMQEGIGIRHGVITTIHDITNTQTVVDPVPTDGRHGVPLGLDGICRRRGRDCVAAPPEGCLAEDERHEDRGRLVIGRLHAARG